jgi:AcrR family transcriptional regulator
MELPVLAAIPAERADAARNRLLILAAAEQLFAERGVRCTSMDAIAAEAGVGKGTLFRRFGDRASLALAVLDRSERSLQEAILHGPPPLGPGAPPRRRLAAFGSAMLDRLEAHSDLLLDAEAAAGGGWMRSLPYAVLWLHVRNLVQQARPDADLDYLADVLVGALSAQAFAHQRQVRQMDLERLKAGYEDLIDRVLGQIDGDLPGRWPSV